MTQFELNQIIGAVSMQKSAAYRNMYKWAKNDEEDESNLERLRKAKIGPGLGRTTWSNYWPGLVASAGGALAGGLLGHGVSAAMGGWQPARALGAPIGMLLGSGAGLVYGANNVASNQTDAIAQAIANGDIEVDSNGKILTRRRRRA